MYIVCALYRYRTGTVLTTVPVLGSRRLGIDESGGTGRPEYGLLYKLVGTGEVTGNGFEIGSRRRRAELWSSA